MDPEASGLQSLQGKISVGIDTYPCGDLHRPPGNGFGIQIRVHERQSCSKGIISARTDGSDRCFGLENISDTGDRIDALGVSHDQHGLQAPEIAICSPVLGQVDTGSCEPVRIQFQLGFKPLDKGKGIGCRSGKTGQDLATGERSDFAGITLDDGLTHGNLTITGNDRYAVFAYTHYGGAVPVGKAVILHEWHLERCREKVKTMAFSSEEIDRYARHLVLREIGGPGQQKLKSARVVLIGMGGLGAPAALYLAAAGVGHLTLVDGDIVSLSNLQRQVLYQTSDIGLLKSVAARDHLSGLNPEIVIHPVDRMADPALLAELAAANDLVLDGTDSFEVRFAVNRACVEAGTPLVSGAIGRWSGQVSVFSARPCYQCLVPELPPDAETCQLAGVVGALAGVIGSMMALEAIKLITGAGKSLEARLLIYDALTAETRTLRLPADPACPVCSTTGSSSKAGAR